MESKHGDEDDEFTDYSSDQRTSTAAESLIESINRSLKFWEMMERPVLREDSFITTKEVRARSRQKQTAKQEMAVSFILKQLSFADLRNLHSAREKLMKSGRVTKLSLKELVKNICSKIHHQKNVEIKNLLRDIDEDPSTAVESLGLELLTVYDQTMGSGIDMIGASTWYEAARVNRGRKRTKSEPSSNSTSLEVKQLLEQAEQLGVCTKQFNLSSFVTERSLLASLKRQIKGKLAKKDLLENTKFASRFFNSNTNHEVQVCDSEIYQQKLVEMKKKLDKNRSRSNASHTYRCSSPKYPGTSLDSRTVSSPSHYSSKKMSRSCSSRTNVNKNKNEINSCGDQEAIGRMIKVCEGSLNLSLKSSNSANPAAGETSSTNLSPLSCSSTVSQEVIPSVTVVPYTSAVLEEDLLCETNLAGQCEEDDSVGNYQQADDLSSFLDRPTTLILESSQEATRLNKKVHWSDAEDDESLPGVWHSDSKYCPMLSNDRKVGISWTQDIVGDQGDKVPECQTSLDTRYAPYLVDTEDDSSPDIDQTHLDPHDYEELSQLPTSLSERSRGRWGKTGLRTLMLASLLAMGAVCYTFSDGEWRLIDNDLIMF